MQKIEIKFKPFADIIEGKTSFRCTESDISEMIDNACPNSEEEYGTVRKFETESVFGTMFVLLFQASKRKGKRFKACFINACGMSESQLFAGDYRGFVYACQWIDSKRMKCLDMLAQDEKPHR